MTDLKELADEQHGIVRRLANTLIDSGFTLQAPCPYHSALRYRGMGDKAVTALRSIGLVAAPEEVDELVPVLASASRKIGVRVRADLIARWHGGDLRWDSFRRRVLYRNWPVDNINRRRLEEWLQWAGVTLPRDGVSPARLPAAKVRQMVSQIEAHVKAGGGVDPASAKSLGLIAAILTARAAP
jgi:hypothetical protein